MDSNISKTISENLMKLRKDIRVRAIGIAIILEISLDDYLKFENGQEIPSLSIMIKISDYYNVSLDWLIGRENKNSIRLDETNSEALKTLLLIKEIKKYPELSDLILNDHISFDKLAKNYEYLHCDGLTKNELAEIKESN